jgi:hypothetical protein
MATPRPRKELKLEDLVKGGHVEARSPEPPQVLESRLRREDADAAHDRYKDKLIAWAVVVVVAVVSAFALVMIALRGTSIETEKWATTILTTVVAGGVGYMTGRGSK